MIKTLHVCTTSLALLISFSACQQATPDEPTAVSPPSSATATTTPVPESSNVSEADDVDYEPAYPTDVSEEALTPEDTAQQDTTHSHDGGEPHSHDGGEAHSHDDASSHDAGEGHGEHDH